MGDSPSRNGAARGLTLRQLLLLVALACIVCGFTVLARKWRRTPGFSTAAFSPDHAVVALGYDDGRVTLADATTGRLGTAQRGHNGYVNRVVFSPDGKRFATAGHKGVVKLWDVAGTGAAWQLDRAGRTITTMSFSPDGSLLALGHNDGTAEFCDVKTGRVEKTWHHSNYLSRLCFSPDGATVVISDFSSAVVLAFPSGETRFTLNESTANMARITFSPDGKTFAAGGRDGRIVIRDSETGQIRGGFQASESFAAPSAFSPDGTKLLTYDLDQVVRLWDLITEQCVATHKDAALGEFDGRCIRRLGNDQGSDSEYLATLDVMTGRVQTIPLPVRSMPLYAWLPLLAAWYVWGLAWLYNLRDSTEWAGRVRAWTKPQDYLKKLRSFDRPEAHLWLAGTLLLLFLTMAAVASLASQYVGLPPELRRPVAGFTVGVLVALCAVPHLRLFSRKMRELDEAITGLCLRARTAWTIGAWLSRIFAMCSSVVLTAGIIAWVAEVSVAFSVFASLSAGYLSWGWMQTQVTREAEAQLVEIHRGANAGADP